MDTHELAWAAGFWDGEGHTHLTKQGYVGLKVPQSDEDRECLFRFQRAVGGLGRVYGPYTNPNGSPNRKPYYVWTVERFETAQAVIAMLWPWLSRVKREQARAALQGARPQRWRWRTSVVRLAESGADT